MHRLQGRMGPPRADQAPPAGGGGGPFGPRPADRRRPAAGGRLAPLSSEATGGPPPGGGRRASRFVPPPPPPPAGAPPPPASSPRGLYASAGGGARAQLLARLGPHTVGKSCVYVKRLSDVDERALADWSEPGVAYAPRRTWRPDSCPSVRSPLERVEEHQIASAVAAGWGWLRRALLPQGRRRLPLDPFRAPAGAGS